VLAPGSDIPSLSQASDGTLYAYRLEGADHYLMKSTDGGGTWSETGYEGGPIADIACSRLDASIIYLTDGIHVYKSSDGGLSFYLIGNNISSALDTNETITCLDVGYDSNGDPIVFIGTADADAAQFGNIYYLTEAYFGATWTDLMVGDYDVYAIAGPPDFDQAPRIIALVTDESHTYIISGHGAIGDWPQRLELLEGNTNNFAATAASRICFPVYFDGLYELFVGVSAGGDGGVYQVTQGVAIDLGLDADVVSLDIAGEFGHTRLLAGGTAGEVWYADYGEGWNTSQKAPTGDGPVYVALALDFAYSGLSYAATSGAESAFSVSRDGGASWNQTGLIDTEISVIVDLAPSPSYGQDNTLFMITSGSGQSLWRSSDGGESWERLYSSALAGVDELERVALPPQYDDGNPVVFIAGYSQGSPAIWKSTDNGQSFTCRIVPFPIDAWAVADENSFFIASFHGGGGLVYRTINSGLSYSQGAVAGNQLLNSIALSPNHATDGTMLVGSVDGCVYWSDDFGASFTLLGDPLPELITGSDSNNVTVAFDPNFSDNSTVYAASHCKEDLNNSSAIYRFIIGDDDWEEIESLDGGVISQLVVSAEGTLYAANSDADGGMERCLNPGFPLGPTFETVTRGLDDGATLMGLWLVGQQLWSIDSSHTRLMSYYDSLSQPVVLTSPTDEAPGVGLLIDGTISNISLDWETLEGATEYEWQLNYTTDFSSIPPGFEGTTGASSVHLPSLSPATTYYWRVRAIAPVLSPWSEKWSFTTSLGGEATAPELESPAAGATGVSISPIFQWSAVAGADSYELVVSTRAAFDNPTILKTDEYALPSNAWQCNINLNYDTTYYWRVRAVNGDTYSAWSAVGAFTTESSSSLGSGIVAEASPPPQPPTSDWFEWFTPAGGVMFLIFMVVMAVMLIAMIILVIKVSKL
jgi:photosystem II stability/assembly factor-like uncharacterized protein